MKVGVPRETKNHEYRVGLTPASVRELVAHGHEVFVESGAGHGIGASDNDYERAGAKVTLSADDVFGEATLIIKVKEPLAVEGEPTETQKAIDEAEKKLPTATG